MGLIHTQKAEVQSEKPTWTKALEFTQFACPCGTDPRLLSGEQRTSHFKLVTSVDDPNSDIRPDLRLAAIFYGPPSRMIRFSIARRSEAVCATAQPGPNKVIK